MDISTNTSALSTAMYGPNKTPDSSLKGIKSKEQAAETAESFEAFFISRMMESMFEGISTEGITGGGNAEKIYRSMLLDEYGKEMAKTGGIGIKNDLMRSILEMQEQASQMDMQG